MTTNDYGSSGGTAMGGAAESGQQAAQTAKEEGKHVADVAMGEAQQVAAEARAQARNLVDEARAQVDEQARTQRDRLVTTLQTFGDDLERMARGEGAGDGMASDVVKQVVQRARDLSSQMDGREPTELLDQVRAFARRRPGTFLVGALAAGIVAGRLTRGVKEVRSSQQSAQTGQTGDTGRLSSGPGLGETGAAGTSTGAPLAGTGYPATDPVYPAGSDTPGTTSPGTPTSAPTSGPYQTGGTP